MTSYYLIETTDAADPAQNKNVVSQGYESYQEAAAERDRRYKELGQKLSITEY